MNRFAYAGAILVPIAVSLAGIFIRSACRIFPVALNEDLWCSNNQRMYQISIQNIPFHKFLHRRNKKRG